MQLRRRQCCGPAESRAGGPPAAGRWRTRPARRTIGDRRTDQTGSINIGHRVLRRPGDLLSPRAGAGKPATTRLILDAARRLIAERGAASVSLQDVADAAAVSKALIHYHFVDRETLLARLVESTAASLIERERDALRLAHGVSAVDGLWTWLEAELARGDVRVFLEVSQDRAPRVQAAARAAAAMRLEMAASTVERLFSLLGLRPRLAPELLAGAVVAFVDGLAFDAPLTPERPARASFDVFWLAMLSLAH